MNLPLFFVIMSFPISDSKKNEFLFYILNFEIHIYIIFWMRSKYVLSSESWMVMLSSSNDFLFDWYAPINII